MSERPTLRQLEYLVALDETLHFGRAAERAHVSQPGLSAQLKDLETLLGTRLFERDRRKVLATDVGRAAAARARRVLDLVDELVDLVRGGAADPLGGTLRLGSIPTVAPHLLPRVLPAVRAAHPRVRILLREEPTERLVDATEDGALDLLVLALEADLGALETMPLADDPFLLVVPRRHRLASRKRVREQDLAGEAVLLLEDGHWLRTQALSVCRSAGAHEAGDFRASSLATLLQMVAGGLGVTLLPRLARTPALDAWDEIVLLPFQRPVPTRTIGLAWRPTSARKDAFRALGRLLRGPIQAGSASAR